MLDELNRDLTEQELAGAEQVIREKWGTEVEAKLDSLLEYKLAAEVGDVESATRQRVIIQYKSTQSFDDFQESFDQLEDGYRKRGESFDVEEFGEFEHIADESLKLLIGSLDDKNVTIEEHLKLGNAIVTELTPAQIKAVAASDRVERIEADKVLKLELDQSTQTVGVVNARTQGLVGTGKGMIIAVLDGEVDCNHPDLKGRVVQKRNYTDEGWGKPHEHGTHVAGIIAGDGQQYKGIAPDAIIWSYKIIPSEQSQSDQGFKGADAIEDVIKDMKDGVKVANCSWGVQSAPLDGTSIWAKTAERAAKLGLVLIKSAGNNGPDAGTITSPADAQGDVIVVGASSHDGTKVMDFSSRGPTADGRPKPDICAPGDNIVAAKALGGYRKMSGTSMAAPHIAGIAALLLERNPTLTPLQVRKILMDSAKTIESAEAPNTQGKGLVDVVKALQVAGQPRSEGEQFTYTTMLKERKLKEILNIGVRNTSTSIMQGVTATLISQSEVLKVTNAQQAFGTLRVGTESARDFEIEVISNGKVSPQKLTLQVNFITPEGEKRTETHVMTHESVSLRN
jgi:serine protease AprX